MKTEILKSLLIGCAIVLSCVILGGAYNYKHRSANTISVTGLAEKDFSSDLIVWTASFNRFNPELKSAYANLKSDEETIKSYLISKDIKENEIIFSSVNMNKEFNRTYDERGNEISATFSGYNLSENVRVESGEIDRVEKLSREVTELLENGIELNSSAPNYYYTKLNELKIDLLARASADAKKRAETIAGNSGSSLGDIKDATMGVFQITGKNTNEDYSYGGVFNTSSRNKTASITLKVNYLIK